VGEGSFADVYEATSLFTGAHAFLYSLEENGSFAIKRTSKSRVENLACLVQEISIMRELSHPGIVNLHRVYEDSNHIDLVLDLVHGETLLDLIWRKHNLTEEACAHIT
jgi:serine/threonine protein kinase